MQQSTTVQRSPLVVTTADLPPATKLETWKAVGDAFFPLEHRRFSEDFQGTLTARTFGAVHSVDVVCDAVECGRTPERIARRSMDVYYIFEQLGAEGSSFLTSGHPDGVVGEGDLVLGDADAPFQSLTNSRFNHRVWLLPRPMVDAIGGFDGTLAQGLHLPRSSPGGRLLASYLAEMQTQWPALSDDELGAYADVAARLLVLAAGGERSEPSNAAVAFGELALVKRRIAQRLADPLLSPARIAADCGMSVRKLHALFSPTGMTFSAFVTQSRLVIARQMLSDPRHATRSVTEIAFALGFNSLSNFYRVFGEAYGSSPGALRADRFSRAR